MLDNYIEDYMSMPFSDEPTESRTLSECEKSFLSAKRALFDKVYAEHLNPEQRRAVFTAKGPLLCLAGAGSGKTTVLVNRIVYLVKYGNAYFTDDIPYGVDEDTVSALNMALNMSPSDIAEILPQFISEPCPPWAILAITFTNKAANEIKSRLLSTFDDKELSGAVWAGTFHSICLRILRKYADRLGYRQGFSIYDTDDKQRMLKACMKELDIDEKRLAPKAVANAISMAKDSLVSCEDYEITSDPRTRDIKRLYTLYEKKMLANNALDFDDIIMRTVELLEDHSDIRDYYQNKFRYVLIDEYQDTNYAQFMLTKIISDKRRNIMVVGDDDQSIYRFRGATIENILNFDKTYPDATVIKLEQNYRSTGNILACANAVIHNNDKRHDKKLWCDKGDGDKIILKEAYDQNDEGKYIVDQIIGGIYKENRKYSDYAVLYRVNALGRTLQTAFAKSGIPFKVVGDLGFYDHKEVKDMIAYLSIIMYEGDNLRLKRIVNEPKRKIGGATVDAVEQLAEMNGLSMYECMRRSDEFPVLAKNVEKLKSFVRLIDDIRNNVKLPSEMIKEVFMRTGYEDMLRAEGFEGEGKIENINEFISAAIEYEKRASEEDTEPTLTGFLEEVFLISDLDKYDEEADAVVLMTVHSAKGLEFPVVFIAGMEDVIFPSEQNRNSTEEMSEERRLAYVAITRAKEKLYITYARGRMMYGRTLYGTLSCFIREEVPRELIERDMPKSAPPRQSIYQQQRAREYSNSSSFTELRRTPDMLGNTRKRESGAHNFGLVKLPVGTRVSHGIFGTGEIISSRDMGGDILYEVAFDRGDVKKLMATFAKLQKIED